MAAKGDATGIESAIEETSAYSIPQPMSLQTRVPSAAKWLGALGAIPFVFLAVTGHFLEGPTRGQAFFALAAYGAVVLSFLGGIHWGLAIAGFGPRANDEASFRRLAFSVTPSLVGWGALLVPPPSGLMLLAVAFVWLLVFDSQASRKAQAPAWYPRLRRPLTLAVVASLTFAALG
jgi:hypothetical protein